MTFFGRELQILVLLSPVNLLSTNLFNQNVTLYWLHFSLTKSAREKVVA